MEQGFIAQAQAWISLENAKVPTLAAISRVELSPEQHCPRSVSWILEGSDFMTQVVLWESGSFEADLAEVATGKVQTNSGQLGDVTELESLLGAARDGALRSR
ncbi:hypothetical protein [Streptomyces lydicus]|uniref:hypothetical protein n=1 Tax=Streptomyces lydicus TaxID=47763 RepID=UPI0028709C30|nr:hypothetical protein [Streptomyces lydicus]